MKTYLFKYIDNAYFTTITWLRFGGPWVLACRVAFLKPYRKSHSSREGHRPRSFWGSPHIASSPFRCTQVTISQQVALLLQPQKAWQWAWNYSDQAFDWFWRELRICLDQSIIHDSGRRHKDGIWNLSGFGQKLLALVFDDARSSCGPISVKPSLGIQVHLFQRRKRHADLFYPLGGLYPLVLWQDRHLDYLVPAR